MSGVSEASPRSNYTIYPNATAIPGGKFDKTGTCGICMDKIDDGTPIAIHEGAVSSEDRWHQQCLLGGATAESGYNELSLCDYCKQPVNKNSLFVGQAKIDYLTGRLQALSKRRLDATSNIAKISAILLVGSVYTLFLGVAEGFVLMNDHSASVKAFAAVALGATTYMLYELSGAIRNGVSQMVTEYRTVCAINAEQPRLERDLAAQ